MRRGLPWQLLSMGQNFGSLGDAVAIAYGPSEGYAGAADPKDAARQLIAKVRTLSLGHSGR